MRFYHFLDRTFYEVFNSNEVSILYFDIDLKKKNVAEEEFARCNWEDIVNSLQGRIKEHMQALDFNCSELIEDVVVLDGSSPTKFRCANILF